MSDRFHNLRKVLEGGDLLLKFSDGRGLSVHQPQMTLASVQLRLYLEDPDESVDGAAEGTAGSKRRRAEAAGPSSSLLEMRSIPVSGVRGCNMFLCVTAIHHSWTALFIEPCMGQESPDCPFYLCSCVPHVGPGSGLEVSRI